MYKILHLTSKIEDFGDPIYITISESKFIYIRHSTSIDLISPTQLKDISLIVKDRFIYSLPQWLYDLNIPIISFIPSYLPYNRGPNSLLWSILDNNPIGGTIFRIYSNNYKIEILHQFQLNNNFDINNTLRSLYDSIFSKLYLYFELNFSSILNYKYSKNLIINNYENYPIRTPDEGIKILSSLRLNIDTPIYEILKFKGKK